MKPTAPPMTLVAADVSPLHPNSQEVSADSRRLPQRTRPALATALVLLAAVGLTPLPAATTRHVWPDSPSPTPPYDSWATAAHVIQDAVNAAVGGDTVLVTNGVYATGGRAVSGTMTNRVAIDRAITVQSVNGPEGTLIVGYGPGGTNGDGAIRCVYLTTNAVLSGFTLTNGHTRTKGDPLTEQGGGGVWGVESAAGSSSVTNCILTGNSAQHGGGAYSGRLYNCTLTGNSAQSGGGGGAYGARLANCTLIGNTADYGGAASSGTLYNCTLTGNSARNEGGGAYSGRLYNCTLTGNSARNQGGGAYSGTLYNCTVTGNSANWGGGTYDSGVYNCIVYYNTASLDSNCSGGTILYSCSPRGGTIADDPQLASVSHLSRSSPCIGAGNASYASGLDIDGEPWANPPCMGADQLTPGNAAGPLTVSIHARYTRLAPGFAAPFVADNTGPVTATVWDFGDGTLATNQAYTSHSWADPGTYAVRLTGYNDSHPGGVTITLIVEVVDEVYYVNAANPSPVFPYTNWQTAATSIQVAIGASPTPARLILVTNGVYAEGGVAVAGTMTNRIALTNIVRVQSVNGPEGTLIVGYGPGGTNGDGAIRCAYVGTNAILSGFTLTNGHTRTEVDTLREQNSGGGVRCSTSGLVTNCILTGNSAEYGGGAYSGMLYNCTLSGNSGGTAGGAYGGTLFNSTLTGNSAKYGGGARESKLYNCTLIGNTAAGSGGGAAQSTLYNCILTSNSAGWDGGGAYYGTLTNCTLTSNSAATNGGGVSLGTLYNCTLTGNSARNQGGGAYSGTLYNCTLTANSATRGGGAYQGTLYNCTLTGNSAIWLLAPLAGLGGGTYDSQLFNCIVYFNTAMADANYFGGSWRYSCTTPLPAGSGNTDHHPRLASATHLSINSPCIGAGSSAFSRGVDIDGEPWADPPCMGADQLTPGSATGPLVMNIRAPYTRFAVGFAAPFRADNTGPITASVWDFGGGAVVTNQPYTTHAWANPGTHEVRLTGYNESHPGGVTTTLTVEVVEEVYYVNAANAAPLFPYTNWPTAATTIQDAIDAGSTPGRLVLVTNGTYATGGVAVSGTMTNRVVLTNGVRVQSVHGPSATVIVGYGPGGTNGDGAIRCAYVGANAILSGFTLTNGHTQTSGDTSGGGAWCASSAVVANCIITGNSASRNGGGVSSGTLHNCTLTGNSTGQYGYGGGTRWSDLYNCTLTSNLAGYGAGVRDCALYNCVLTGNSAYFNGGGAYGGTLYNCTLTGNSAEEGGGAYASMLYNCTLSSNSAQYSGGGAYGIASSPCTLDNCIVYYNTANSSPNHNFGGPIQYSCTTPLPPGEGNITNAPLFVDRAAGDFRLLPGSPGIDAGTNVSALLTTDLAGLPRPLDGNGDGVAAFDMGAYEFLLPTADSNGDGIPDGWTHQHGLNPTDPTVGAGNPDGDEHTTFQEWQADTDPSNAHSCFRIEAIAYGSPVAVQFLSSSNRVYTLRSATNLTEGSWSDLPGQADVPGTGGLHSLADTNTGPSRFYRVGVRVP